MDNATREQKDLVHADPHCTGQWTEVSARSTKGIKPRTGRHYFCPKCKAHFPVGAGYDRSYFEAYENARRMDRLMVEQRAAREMVGEIIARFPDTTRDHADELVEAAMHGLSSAFFRVEEDRMAKFEWQSEVRRLTDDTTKRVREVLDSALGSYRIARIQVARHGGELEYMVEVDREDRAAEASVMSIVSTIEPPPQFEGVEVAFRTRKGE